MTYDQFKDTVLNLDALQHDLAHRGNENRAEKVAQELYNLLDQYPAFNLQLGEEQREWYAECDQQKYSDE